METSSAFDAAHVAAEGVRRLNHLTLDPTGSASAGEDVLGDLCAVLGELRLLARRLPQGLGQLADILEYRERYVRLGVDNDDDPAVVLSVSSWPCAPPVATPRRSVESSQPPTTRPPTYSSRRAGGARRCRPLLYGLDVIMSAAELLDVDVSVGDG